MDKGAGLKGAPQYGEIITSSNLTAACALKQGVPIIYQYTPQNYSPASLPVSLDIVFTSLKLFDALLHYKINLQLILSDFFYIIVYKYKCNLHKYLELRLKSGAQTAVQGQFVALGMIERQVA